MLQDVDDAARASAAGDPVAMQRLYDAARDLAEALVVAPIPRSCAPLASALGAARPRGDRGRGDVRPAARVAREGRAGGVGAGPGRAGAVAVQARPGDGASGCVAAGRARTGRGVLRRRPRASARGFGERRHRRRRRSCRDDRRAPGVVRDADHCFHRAAPRLEVRYLDVAGKRLSSDVSPGVFLLPRSAARVTTGERADAALSNRLATVARAFDGYAAVRVQRLGTGTVGGWNEDARFPAASTVKLAVLIEAARLHGLAPRSRVLYDVEQAAGWSSNLAANRLLATIGGTRVAERRLRLLGARSSTYPGEYRVGTARTGAPRQPPLSTQRVTTARDLGTVMRALHLAAVGRPAGRAATGLSMSTARVLLRALLESEPRSATTRGLVLPFAPRAAAGRAEERLDLGHPRARRRSSTRDRPGGRLRPRVPSERARADGGPGARRARSPVSRWRSGPDAVSRRRASTTAAARVTRGARP